MNNFSNFFFLHVLDFLSLFFCLGAVCCRSVELLIEKILCVLLLLIYNLIVLLRALTIVMIFFYALVKTNAAFAVSPSLLLQHLCEVGYCCIFMYRES